MLLLEHHSRTSTIIVRDAGAADAPAVGVLLSRTSPEALAQRFLTGMAGPPPPRLVSRLLAADGVGGGALLAWRDGEPVGHAMWTPVGAHAEIALLVRHDHQRRGVGTALLDALSVRLRAADVRWVQVTTAASNRAVTALVRSRRPGARAEVDGTELTYTLTVEAARRGSGQD